VHLEVVALGVHDNFGLKLGQLGVFQEGILNEFTSLPTHH
jgi:hypothetical protein